MHAINDKQGIDTTNFLLNILTIIKLIRCKIRNIFPYSCRNNLFSDYLSEKKRRINKEEASLETGVDNKPKMKKKYQFVWLSKNMLYLCGVLFN